MSDCKHESFSVYNPKVANALLVCSDCTELITPEELAEMKKSVEPMPNKRVKAKKDLLEACWTYYNNIEGDEIHKIGIEETLLVIAEVLIDIRDSNLKRKKRT